MQIARENNVVISTTLFHQRYRKFITVENARAWAKWVAQRYKNVPTIVWSMTPEAKPGRQGFFLHQDGQDRQWRRGQLPLGRLEDR